MEVSVELYNNGRVTIPTQIRKLLNMKGGDELIFRVEDDTLTVLTEEQLLAEARAAYKADAPTGYNAVDEIIAERRLEAAKEESEYRKYDKDALQIDDLLS